MTTTSEDSALAVAAIIAAIRELQPQLAEGGFKADATNSDPTENMKLLSKTNAQRLYVPVEFGGLMDPNPFHGWRATFEAQVEIARGDGPTCQNWGTTGLVARMMFNSPEVPHEVKKSISERLLNENLRMVSSHAMTGVSGPTIGRRVDGGIVIKGTKSFNTNSAQGGLALVGIQIEGEEGIFEALVDLGDPNVEYLGDWDNMGQRGTQSVTINYNDVFVADGWFFRPVPNPSFLAAAQLLGASLNVGIGFGALVAATEYTKGMKRASLKWFSTPVEDPLMLKRLGEMASALEAGRALVYETASRIETATPADIPELAVAACNARVACVRASVFAGEQIFDLTGARSTTNGYRYDRFWRNARTFASHDPLDAKAVAVGKYLLTDELAMDVLIG